MGSTKPVTLRSRTIIGFSILVVATVSILLLTATTGLLPLNQPGHASQINSHISWLFPGAYAIYSGSEETIPDVPCVGCPNYGISLSNFSLTVVILEHNSTHYEALSIISGTMNEPNAPARQQITWFRLFDPVNPFPWGQGLPSNRTYQADVRMNNRTIGTVVHEYRNDKSGTQSRVYSTVDEDFPVKFSYTFVRHDIYVIDLQLSQSNIAGLRSVLPSVGSGTLIASSLLEGELATSFHDGQRMTNARLYFVPVTGSAYSV